MNLKAYNLVFSHYSEICEGIMIERFITDHSIWIFFLWLLCKSVLKKLNQVKT